MEAILRHLIDHMPWRNEAAKRKAHELLDAAVAGGGPPPGAADAAGGAGDGGQGGGQ